MPLLTSRSRMVSFTIMEAGKTARASRAVAFGVVALLLAVSVPAAFGQARGGGRLGQDSTRQAEGGGGLSRGEDTSAKGGGGMQGTTGEGAQAGGGLSSEGARAAGSGGGLAKPEERTDEDDEKGPGGALGGGMGKSKTGGAMALGEQASPIRYLATWVPAIGFIILLGTIWYLRSVKGKR